jgi:hypothetical protein
MLGYFIQEWDQPFTKMYYLILDETEKKFTYNVRENSFKRFIKFNIGYNVYILKVTFLNVNVSFDSTYVSFRFTVLPKFSS